MLVACSAFAASSDMFGAYEHVRQGLLKASVREVHSGAQELATAARASKQNAVATRTDAVSATTDIASARAAFAVLSDEMIKYRATVKGSRPVVVYCSMENKSWLQPASPISNPYVAPSMRTCGDVRKD